MKDSWISTHPPIGDEVEYREEKCHRCYGSGEDEVGADCIACEGYGTILTPIYNRNR